MTTCASSQDESFAVDLPPAFSRVAAPEGVSAFVWSCEDANRLGAGTLVIGQRPNLVDFAVVFEPEEPLRTARRAFFAAMLALAEAVGAIAPPEKAVNIVWPSTLLFDGARLGGGRLAWPDGTIEDDIPEWLVFSATLIASKGWAGDPGLTPDSTSLEEEGFGPVDEAPLIASFARYLLRAFDLWHDRGFQALADLYCARLISRMQDDPPTIDEAGDLRPGEKGASPLALLVGLEASVWLDRETGAPRL